MMKRLYVIGAGASASVPYGLPTIKSLFWEIYNYVKPEEQRVLKEAAYDACNASLEDSDNSPNFEDFLNKLDARQLLYLSESSLRTKTDSRSAAASIALKRLREFIHHKCAEAKDLKGPYDHLISSLNEDQAVVSFNWDVLFEISCRRAARKYGYLPSNDSKDEILLLKPHDSINWFPLLEREGLIIDTSENIDVLGRDLNNYMLYLKDPLGPITLGNSSPNAKVSIAPLAAIVPPDAAHLLSIEGITHNGFVDAGHLRVMEKTWAKFRDLIDTVNEVVVIGYSLPDVAAIKVMKRFAMSIKMSSNKKRLVVIDKNPKVLERYKRIVFDSAELACEDFCDFSPDIL